MDPTMDSFFDGVVNQQPFTLKDTAIGDVVEVVLSDSLELWRPIIVLGRLRGHKMVQVRRLDQDRFRLLPEHTPMRLPL